jgi:hypothetical protein
MMLAAVRSMSELCRLSLNYSGFDAGDKDRETNEQNADSGIDDECSFDAPIILER